MPSLSQPQLDVVAGTVSAVVERDAQRLAKILGGADALYAWTRSNELYDACELRAPPGPPAEWSIAATEIASMPRQVHVVVALSTRGAARELRLELILTARGSLWESTIHDLVSADDPPS